MQFEKVLPRILLIVLLLFLLSSMISISLSQIFLSISLLSWIILIIKKNRKFAVPSFFWILAVYIILSVVSSFFSVNPEISLKDCRELFLFLIIPLIYTGFNSEKELKNANLAILASGFISIIFSFLYFIFKAKPGERITGFMGHYMTQAGLLMLFACLSLSILCFYRTKNRTIWGLGFFLSLPALLLTYTRSAWIGLIIAACIILFFYKPKILILMPVVVALCYFLSPSSIRERALSIFSLNSPSNVERLEYARAGWMIIKEFPLFGTGPDTVDMVFQNPKYELSKDARRNVHLHNNITQIAAERGILTLLVWVIFIVWVFLSLIKLLKNKDPSVIPLAVAAIASLFALMVAGLFEYNFGDSEITTLFLYIITIPFAMERIGKIQEMN